MNWFKKLLACKTNYLPQVLSDKQKAILNEIDILLTQRCTLDTTGTNVVIKSAKLGLFSQHYGVGYIMGYMKSAIATEGYGYIPRSVALIVDPDGTWSFYFALRTTGSGDSEIVAELFSNALARTNDAR